MNIGHLVRRSVESVPATTSCAEAARRMRDSSVGSLVVAEAGRPLGIVTDRDLVVRVLATGGDADKLAIGDVMSRKPVFVTQTRDVAYVLELMSDLAVRRIPVVDEDHKLVGVVALDDIILSLSGELAAVAETIRKEM
ncbi:MAG: CBS domain-containing protein [Myxococcota bacterium]